MNRYLAMGMAVVGLLVPTHRGWAAGSAGHAVPYTAFLPAEGFPLPEIVLQYDPEAKTGANWEAVNHPQWFEATPPILMGRAATFLREGLKRMTGQEFPVVSRSDLSRGIVLTLFRQAPESVRNDPDVLAALREDPADPYAAVEAFFIQSETNRLLVVANTPDGLLDAVVELLESVEYEVLGMGPDWVYAPDYRDRPLVFTLKRAGRPSYYIRSLVPTSGQMYGVGTIMGGLSNRLDETVDVSNWRWQIGARLYGKSMAPFPGHALQAFHRPVLEHMRKTGVTEGFLAPRTVVKPAAERPAPDVSNNGWLWIHTDAEGTPAAGKTSISDGKSWVTQDLGQIGCNLDLSVPFVRGIILEGVKKQAAAAFEREPDELAVIGIDAEDGGGYGVLDTLMKYKTWFSDYLKQEKVKFGRPYVLHGYKGLDQPKEIWDPAAASDTMFGFANWLLRELDKWVDAMPAEQRVTTSGRDKKAQLRCSFYSYNYHDVPPNFNVDPRVRVMIASYPKHRGRGKWEAFKTQEDMARAFKVMLPREPSGDYRIYSLAYYWDPGPSGIPARWSASPAFLAEEFGRTYDAGYRAVSIETDYNFGKFGLGYYLISRMFWNAKLTAAELDAIRDRWFHRAFGSAWQEMKAYYDFMLVDNYPVNGPNTWAKAIRLIDAADRKLDGAREPEAQRRVDDVKEYWYYHYLMDTGRYTVKSPEVQEYLWKGQMSYMVALHVLARRDFGTDQIRTVLPASLTSGPAHYTHEETQAWWAKVLDQWKETPVRMFRDMKLTNGVAASTVDLNDLVMVREFQGKAADVPFVYNSGYMKPVPFLVVAQKQDDPVGFKLSWPFNADDNYYVAKKVPYGAEIWDPARKAWDAWVDKTMVVQQSVLATNAQGRPIQVATVRLKAPRPGTYRFDIGYGGNAASLGSLAFDPVAGNCGSNRVAFTYYTGAEGLTQSPVYIYIPKGTRSVDLEVWDQYKGKALHLYKGLPASNPPAPRKVDISEMGTHTIALEAGEDGTVAMLTSNGFAFPYLYSLPTLWAKSPGALLVPRAIAEADGLTVLE